MESKKSISELLLASCMRGPREALNADMLQASYRLMSLFDNPVLIAHPRGVHILPYGAAQAVVLATLSGAAACGAWTALWTVLMLAIYTPPARHCIF